MGLTKCPECDRPVSDQAKSCPNCGHPLRTGGKGAKSLFLIALALAIFVTVYHAVLMNEFEKRTLGMPESLSMSINPITNLVTLRFNIGSITKGDSTGFSILGAALGAKLAEGALGDTLKQLLYRESRNKFDLYGMVVPYRIEVATGLYDSDTARYNKRLDAAVEADLRCAMMAFEGYYADHKKYPDSVEELTQYGFYPSTNVRVIIEAADSKGYTLRGYHEYSNYELIVSGPRDIPKFEKRKRQN
jgi:hypothetical protein